MIRPTILAFAEAMEHELQANAYKDKHSAKRSRDLIVAELHTHVDKLLLDTTLEHAADVANLVMMLYVVSQCECPAKHYNAGAVHEPYCRLA